MSLGPARKATGLIAAFGAGALACGGSAAGQNVADNARIARGNEMPSACAHIKSDTPQGVAALYTCTINELKRRQLEAERRGAAADARGAAADARATAADTRSAEADRRNACTTTFIAEIKASPERLQAARSILGGKSIREVDPCAVLEQLRKG
jgi:hypothetical protein